jgi:hypothetical protein
VCDLEHTINQTLRGPTERGFRLGRFEGSGVVGSIRVGNRRGGERTRWRRESPWRRLHSGEMENGGERECLMEERENKRLRLTGLRGVNLSCAMHMIRTRVKYPNFVRRRKYFIFIDDHNPP